MAAKEEHFAKSLDHYTRTRRSIKTDTTGGSLASTIARRCFRDFGPMISSAEFMVALCAIIGPENAQLCARKFQPLDGLFSVHDMPNYEAMAFYVYTTELEWHQIINSELWNGKPRKEIVVFAEVLDQGLRRIPCYVPPDGVVYRGFRVPKVTEFAKQFEVESVIRFPAFTSASYRREMAYGGNVFFTIRPLNARSIWYMAANFHEYEVLFPTNCHFRVIENETITDRLSIVLEEVRSS